MKENRTREKQKKNA